MKKTVALFALCLAILLSTSNGLLAGQGKDRIGQGRKLFLNYCASCHGMNGAGDGPVASSLKKVPPDLRRLQSKHSKFSSDELRKTIAGDQSVPVHGEREMPVWGFILTKPDIDNLVKYIESIQKPFETQPAG